MLLRNKRVFIIEDNLNNRAIVQLILEREGAYTAFERWGVHVIEQLVKFMPIDVILLDLMFPNGVTGYDVFDKIRADAQFRHIPIVAVSAADTSTAIPKTKERGFSGYISKPVDFLRLPHQILSIIKGEELWDTSN
jgi:CheY-like chemotaxis protein